mgnify:CR=1 FL=1
MKRSSLLRRCFSTPGTVDILPGNSMNDYGNYVSDSTIRRWKRLGYIEKRGMFILTQKGYHAA